MMSSVMAAAFVLMAGCCHARAADVCRVPTVITCPAVMPHVVETCHDAADGRRYCTPARLSTPVCMPSWECRRDDGGMYSLPMAMDDLSSALQPSGR